MNKTRTAGPVKKRADPAREWEQLQLHRLLWAIVLFLTVFLGKQIYPEKMLSVGEQVMDVMSYTTDFEAVFEQLGASILDAEGLLPGLSEFCTEVFGPQEESQPEQTEVFSPQVPQVSSGLLQDAAQHIAIFSEPLPEAQSYQAEAAQYSAEQEPAVQAVGTVLTVGTAQDQPLPEGYTMDELSFGALETAAPVVGLLNSSYGYRNHPVNGTYSFHGGVDINANAGDPIAAFADGTVEYIGEDDSYGLYFQLDHGNGIKSFYAHCQGVCVQTGQQVTMGETVAKVGSTGCATGPHLHLELKCGGLHVDPTYYLDFLSAA